MAVLPPQPVQRGILEQSLFPFYPFQQAVVELIPHRTHSRIPELMEVLNDTFDHRIKLTSQLIYRLAPLVDVQLLEFSPDSPL